MTTVFVGIFLQICHHDNENMDNDNKQVTMITNVQLMLASYDLYDKSCHS